MDKSILHIGFSGHQQFGDETTQQFVVQQIRELLATYQQQACEHGQKILVYSTLAMSSDQLFVKTALELSIPVMAVIPFTQDAEILPTPEARDEYHRLLNSCQDVHSLPFDDCSDDAFLAAGRWVVDHSDLAILVWNGYPAAGRGGVGDIASYARLVGRLFIYIHIRLHIVKQYGSQGGSKVRHEAAKRKYAISKETVYQGPILTVNKYQMRMPGGEVIERDVVKRPESVDW